MFSSTLMAVGWLFWALCCQQLVGMDVSDVSVDWWEALSQTPWGFSVLLVVWETLTSVMESQRCVNRPVCVYPQQILSLLSFFLQSEVAVCLLCNAQLIWFLYYSIRNLNNEHILLWSYQTSMTHNSYIQLVFKRFVKVGLRLSSQLKETWTILTGNKHTCNIFFSWVQKHPSRDVMRGVIQLQKA